MNSEFYNHRVWFETPFCLSHVPEFILGPLFFKTFLQFYMKIPAWFVLILFHWNCSSIFGMSLATIYEINLIPTRNEINPLNDLYFHIQMYLLKLRDVKICDKYWHKYIYKSIMIRWTLKTDTNAHIMWKVICLMLKGRSTSPSRKVVLS
jgi:hypothetical protein